MRTKTKTGSTVISVNETRRDERVRMRLLEPLDLQEVCFGARAVRESFEHCREFMQQRRKSVSVEPSSKQSHTTWITVRSAQSQTPQIAKRC